MHHQPKSQDSHIRKAYIVVDSNHKIFDARDITFNEFENLAGQKGFPGPDAVILGMYEEDTPFEPDEEKISPSPSPSEIKHICFMFLLADTRFA